MVQYFSRGRKFSATTIQERKKMKKIQILGTGCSKCKKLEDNVREAVKTLDLDCEVEKVTDIQEIMKFGIMMTPGLIIDGKVISSGRILNIKEITNILTTHHSI